ncbi:MULTISPECIES: DUF429 domain-containing protein [unclassified Saccharicrinis]|uniref:DUF429 domain-containing protein n=1 Tax=unclassified Saccharicrinis TaxID=2646859 RepID=UPI003D346735
MDSGWYIGIDGCRGGWLFSVLDDNRELNIKLFRNLTDGIDLLRQSEAVSIDMPMGIVSEKGEERVCDALARKELGHPFSSSVFNVPCRQAVYAGSYPEANALNREIQGKGISIQAWNIVPKIKELDMFLDEHPILKEKLHESHPELCFKNLKGAALSYKKKTVEGVRERLVLLKTLYPNIEKHFHVFRNQFFKKDVVDDDVLDSMVLVFNAMEIAKGNYNQFPDCERKNNCGIRMVVFIGNMDLTIRNK